MDWNGIPVLALSAAASAAPSLPVAASVFGWAAGTIGVGVGWPQAWRLWVGRKDAGLSMSSNVLTVLFATAWFLYGVASHRTVQIATAAAGLAICVTVLAGHLRLSRPPLRNWLPLLLAGWVVLALVFAAGRGPLGVTASAATVTGVLPQLVSLVRARARGVHSVAGISIARWVLSVACNVLWFGYGLLARDPLIVGNCIIIGSLSTAIVVLTSWSARTERSYADPAAYAASQPCTCA